MPLVAQNTQCRVNSELESVYHLAIHQKRLSKTTISCDVSQSARTDCSKMTEMAKQMMFSCYVSVGLHHHCRCTALPKSNITDNTLRQYYKDQRFSAV